MKVTFYDAVAIDTKCVCCHDRKFTFDDIT